MSEVKQYVLEYGVGGGYNDIQFCYFEGTYDDASNEAVRLSTEMAETYGIGDDIDESEYDNEDDLNEVINDVIESFLSYAIHPYTKESLEKADGSFYYNESYSKIENPLEDLFDKQGWTLS